ncbi:hypothetical protein HNY73_019193 [Argiope bruennichi]|uniref:Uncharacterized protein n=1 Tax=Argiope bruennichi TaxID=94029 RepID=A0A8T0EGT6_ARGBR|nr:hypothetical protein HNY73_019193 [Argiope bruennichi]
MASNFHKSLILQSFKVVCHCPVLESELLGALPISDQPSKVSMAVNPQVKVRIFPVINFPAVSAPISRWIVDEKQDARGSCVHLLEFTVPAFSG